MLGRRSPGEASFDVIARSVRLVDGSPADILRRDVVGEPSEAAGHTVEVGLGGTVRAGHVPAAGTGLGRVVRIDVYHGDAGQAGLVLDEGPELAEGPAVERGPLSATNRDPLADPLEVLQGECPAGALRAGHELLGDTVIDIGLKAPFLPPAEPEAPRRRPGAFGLELPAEATVAVPETENVGPGVSDPV